MASATRPRTPTAGKSSSPAVIMPALPMPQPPTTSNHPLPSASSSKNQSQPATANVPAAARRSSLGILLRRSKSNEFGSRKRAQVAREQELLRQQQARNKSPPRLPQLYNGATPPRLQTFGGDHRATQQHNMMSSGRSSMDPSAVPVPPIPASIRSSTNGDWVDPYARAESMTHRGRYSYASSHMSTINSPRRVRRRKDPTPFNILIIGATSAGKTSFLNFLKTSLALPAKKRPTTRPSELLDDIFAPQDKSTHGTFEPHYLETEIDGERVGLTLWDSEGLEKNAIDLQLRDMSHFLEAKFEDTFTEEMKVIRAPGVQDTHIHCAFLILDPTRIDRNLAAAKASSNIIGTGAKNQSTSRIVGGLDEDFDLQVMRTLQGKTTVIPIISKADTITTAHMSYLKRTVWEGLRKANLDPLEALGLDDLEPESPAPGFDEEDEDDLEVKDLTDYPVQSPDAATPSKLSLSSPLRSTTAGKRFDPFEVSTETPYLPLSIISPDMYDPGVIGRKFPWGFADPMNAEHCDFVRLKESVFSEWRGDLREASREVWYEGWRTSRLKQREMRTSQR